MKKLRMIFALLVAIGLYSCSEEVIEPIQQVQEVLSDPTDEDEDDETGGQVSR